VYNPWGSGATAQHQKTEASSDRAIPTPAADWRACHREARTHWGALYPAEEAAELAWGELLSRWHRLHGARGPERQCAGCGEPIGGFAALTLADGNRLHLHKLYCLLRFGERWRNEAAASLSGVSAYETEWGG
jgi:hypothetical protein